MRTISTPLGQVELKVKCKVYEVYQARAKSKVKLESFRFLNWESHKYHLNGYQYLRLNRTRKCMVIPLQQPGAGRSCQFPCRSGKGSSLHHSHQHSVWLTGVRMATIWALSSWIDARCRYTSLNISVDKALSIAHRSSGLSRRAAKTAARCMKKAARIHWR